MKHAINNQRGQGMAGYFVILMAVLMGMISLGNYIIVVRKNSANREMKELALHVARSGFEEATSFFRRNASGMYIRFYSNGAVDQSWITPWPAAPDWAFAPKTGDTDYFNSISITGVDGSAVGRAIIRDFPLHLSRVATTSNELVKAGLWGRYVVRRQNVRNWSPGTNTMAAATFVPFGTNAGGNDPEAAHDISQNRDFSGGTGSNSVLGTGNYWSLVSRGYVYASPDVVSAPASCENNDLTFPPRETYNNKALRLASAKVYGELFRINFKLPAAAIYVNDGSDVEGNSNSQIIGGSNYGIARTLNNAASGSPVITGSAGQYLGSQAAPSVPGTFPGMTKSKLQKLADRVGGIGIFPTITVTASQFTEDVSTVRFYYLSGASAYTFSPSQPNRFQGVGMVFVDGNLVIDASAATGSASWAGVVFVDGTVTLTGSVEIAGTLVSTALVSGTGDAITLNGNINKTTIEYNLDAINTVTSFLQDFKVYKPSVITSYN